MAVNLADYFARTRGIESGGDPNAVSPTGATGVYQFIPSTWRQYGGGGDIHDPTAQQAAMERLTAANAAALTKVLGREPTAGELYLAHQQGAFGASRLLGNPGASPASMGLGNAVRVNGGDPNAPASAFISKWTSKFGDAPAAAPQVASLGPAPAPAAPPPAAAPTPPPAPRS